MEQTKSLTTELCRYLIGEKKYFETLGFHFDKKNLKLFKDYSKLDIQEDLEEAMENYIETYKDGYVETYKDGSLVIFESGN